MKQHWGKEYLHRENVFYRMLLISAMTSYQRLLGDEKYQALLREQVETLSKELDESPYGLLDDYPGQCYPTDVVAAIAAIKRADAVLRTDHSDFVERSVRGFEGKLVDYTGLVPYKADSKTGTIGPARGCSNQWLTVWTPQLWPRYARDLYGNFEKHFWQERCALAGFREFAEATSHGAWSQWYVDVDSGPVIAGYGVSASAFGIGAAGKWPFRPRIPINHRSYRTILAVAGWNTGLAAYPFKCCSCSLPRRSGCAFCIDPYPR